MHMATLTVAQEVVDGLGQVAQEMGVEVNDLADKAIRQYLRHEAERKIASEETAYQAQHPRLLTLYGGRFIAMHNGQVIDHDADELALYLRVRHQYPQLGILIKRVTTEAEEVWQMRSPRLEVE